MVRLVWMESEVGSAVGLPNESIILQKVRPDEFRKCCPQIWGIQISGLRDSGWWVLTATPACPAVPAGLRLAAGVPGQRTALSAQV
jgi:hypothetical protein